MTDESFNSPKLCCLKEMLVSKNKEKSLCGENNKSAALLGYLDMGKCRPALHLHPRKKSNELKINKMKVINTTTTTSTTPHHGSSYSMRWIYFYSVLGSAFSACLCCPVGGLLFIVCCWFVGRLSCQYLKHLYMCKGLTNGLVISRNHV